MGKSISVGNRQYDAVTGLPLSNTDGRGHVGHISRRTLRASSRLAQNKRLANHEVRPASSVHGKTQRSTTLNRAYIKNKQPSRQQSAAQPTMQPVTAAAKTPQPVASLPKKPADTVVSRHTSKRVDGVHAPKRSLTRQQASPVTPSTTPAKKQRDSVAQDQPASVHPLAQKAHHQQTLRKHEAARTRQSRHQTPPASVIKQAVVNEALDTAPKHHAKQLKLGIKYRTKLFSIVCGCLALMLLGGYLTYLNAPNLSVRIAAAQAGIDASYPNYHPDGYSLHGPVAFNSGEVSMTFVANANKEVSYYLQQSRSNWDSQALLENYVKGQSGGEYSTSQINGMTIYTYDGNAAWVSGGILYTINGNAHLSPDQIRKIATSLS